MNTAMVAFVAFALMGGAGLVGLHWLVRVGPLVLAGTLWTLQRKRALFRVIIVANALFTAILLKRLDRFCTRVLSLVSR